MVVQPGVRNGGFWVQYPTAFLPVTIGKDVDTPFGTNPHHSSTHTVFYNNTWSSGPNNGSFTVLPSAIIDKSFDCAAGCTGTRRNLSWTSTAESFDVYGNMTYHAVYHFDPTGAITNYRTDTTTYKAADTTNWLVLGFSVKP